MSRYRPKAFTERGLYMLATILKSPRATQTTIAIIESYAKLKELSRNISVLKSDINVEKKQTLAQKTGALFNELLNVETVPSSGSTTMELNMMSISLHLKKDKSK